MYPDQRARSEFCKSQDANVAKNAYWWADCPKHGRQAHHALLGGTCEKCQIEKLEAAGLLPEIRPRFR